MRSGFEKTLAKQSPFKKLPYEPMKLEYVDTRHYVPDWVDAKTKTIYEAKGRFTREDRRKMLLVKQQYPDWNIVFIFQTPNAKINKRSKTTYREWALKHGFTVWAN